MRTEHSKVTCTQVVSSQYDQLQAELRQTVTTYYPNEAVNAGHDELFSFEGEETPYSSERVVWINVPEGTTKEQVDQRLASMPNCCITRTLSFVPILEEGDIANGVSVEEKSRSQIVCDESGEVVYRNGKPMFRRYYFRTTKSEDVDLREQTAEKAYMPLWLQGESEISSNAAASYAEQSEDLAAEEQTF